MLDKRGYFQFIAIFMSCLIMTIPFYSANVFAGLDSITAKGSDSINNYVRAEDYVNFEATVSVSGNETVDKSKVWLGNNYEFDSCTPTINAYECTLRYPANGTELWESKSNPYTINLKDNNSNIVESKSGIFYVDNLAPSVTSFSITPEASNGPVNLSYAVEDYAYASGDVSKCAGIKKIEFRQDSASGTLLGSLSLDTSNCSVSGAYDYTYSGSNGSVKICAIAYDRFEQNSTGDVCDTFTFDATAPGIDSVDLVDSSGSSIYYLGNESSTSAYVKANITASDLDTSTIKADLSDVGLGEEVSPDSTTTADNTTTATWSVSISTGTTTISIKVNASDTAGNIAAKTLKRTLSTDTTPPVVTSLKTAKFYNETSYAKSTGNNFTATFTETESGLNPSDVKLYVGTSSVSADECSSGWTCYWYNVDVSGSTSVSAYIGTDTKDRAGNAVEEKFSINVTIDNTKPVIDSIEVNSSGIGGYISTGDTITVTAKITDDSPAYGYADLSEAISDMSDSYALCSEQNSTLTCEWSGTVDSGQKTSAKLTFKIYDIVDNYAEGSKTISIYGAQSGTPDFYTLVLDEDYIDPIDSQVTGNLVTTYYYQIVPFTLEHDGSCSSVDIVDVKLSGSGCSSGSYVNYNKVSKDYAGFFQFAISPSSVSGDSITIGGGNGSCYLEFNVVCDNNIYSTAEKESVYFNIPVVDSLAPDESLTDTIDEAKDRAESGLGKLIELLDKLVVILQNICKIKTIFSTLFTLFDNLGRLYSALMANPKTKPAAKAGEVKTTLLKQAKELLFDKEKGVGKIIDQMCSLVMCSSSGTKKTSFSDMDWESWKGGEFCDILRNMIISVIPNEYVGGFVGASWPSTLELAKKSWIFSIGCLCVPGMIYNLKKQQEIECWRAYCYQKMVPAGLPKEECDKQHSYHECVYWTGQFSVFLDILAAPLNMIMNYLANPIASAWTGARFAFKNQCNPVALTCPDAATCKAVWSTSCTFYTIMVTLENIAQISQFIETLDQMKWKPTMDFCDLLE